MNLSAINNSTPFKAALVNPASSAQLADKAPKLGAAKTRDEFRQQAGEFVGNIFYGTLIKQMQESSFKTKYYHGGRGEDVFQGQLGIELAQRLGRSANNPVADRLASVMEKRLGLADSASNSPPALSGGAA